LSTSETATGRSASRASARIVIPAVVAMTRPSQLLLVAAVMLLGTAFAAAHGTSPDPGAMVVGLMALVLVAAGIHLADEYADHETDRLTSRTPFSGGSGALARTGLPRSVALRAAQVATVAGFGAALAGWSAGVLPGPALVILCLGAAGGWAYSLGPFPLAWHGQGEAANGVLGGMLLPLFGVAVAGASVDVASIAAFVPLTLVVTANLLATTWPDRAADAAVGKRTLATRWQPAGLRHLFATLAGGAAVLLATGLLAWPAVVALAGLSAVPLLVVGLAWYTRRESPLPTVAAMVWLVVAQLGAWTLVALG
jgi:1,4-dihydroxy-2-naphthoate octaprenyltransferase